MIMKTGFLFKVRSIAALDKDFVTKYPYKAVSDSVEKQILQHRNCVVIKNLPDYNTNKDSDTPTNRILTSMLSKERFLFLLRYGFAYVDRMIELEDGSKMVSRAVLSGIHKAVEKQPWHIIPYAV